MFLHPIHIDAPRYVLSRLPERVQRHTTTVLVVGGGAAGLAAALRAAECAEVIVLTRDALPDSNSAWAQGGIAAALDVGDSPLFHVEDTLIAGAGLSDPAAVEVLTREAPALMRELADLGVPFERKDDGFALGLEGGHSRRRILHVGDATGWALTSTLIARARACPRIHILEGYQAVDLTGAPEYCTGMLALDHTGAWHHFAAGAIILATGGAGALYGLTSNQPGALGEGIALAYRAGAEVVDMEFVQFHPTVFRTRANQGFLISEAVRGEGARLLAPHGHRFMPEYDPRAELAPRDVVTRGIFAAMQRESVDHVLLDLSQLPAAYLRQRFPTIYARCLAEGIDLTVDPIPVAPAAHYLMGGIRTDLHGATSLAGLYAAGECACTGVHGSNRLASNSLLECLVFGRRAATAALSYATADRWCDDGRITRTTDDRPWTTAGGSRMQEYAVPSWRSALAQVMRTYASPLRSAASLTEALRHLAVFPDQLVAANPDLITAANAALVARLIVASALLREESRGAHFRADFPYTDETWRVHQVLCRDQSPATVATVAGGLMELAA